MNNGVLTNHTSHRVKGRLCVSKSGDSRSGKNGVHIPRVPANSRSLPHSRPINIDAFAFVKKEAVACICPHLVYAREILT